MQDVHRLEATIVIPPPGMSRAIMHEASSTPGSSHCRPVLDVLRCHCVLFRQVYTKASISSALSFLDPLTLQYTYPIAVVPHRTYSRQRPTTHS